MLAGQSTPAAPSATLQAYANLVVVDVVVTDAHQHPVHGLTAKDFSLLEDGNAQAIKSFEEHAAGEAAKLPAAPKVAPGVFTNDLPISSTGPLNVLLLDSLNTPVKDQQYVREQLLQYIKKSRPGTRIAIFGLTTQLRQLQGFTSDPEVLRAAVVNKAGSKGSALSVSPSNDDVPGTGSNRDQGVLFTHAESDAVTVMQQFETEQQFYQLQLRIRYTLDGLNQLGRYLSHLPGRKNLIWFSGSFPVSILPVSLQEVVIDNPFKGAADYQNEFRETVDLLAHSQVSVYPVDARGVISSPIADASDSNAGRAYGSLNPGILVGDQLTFSQQTGLEHGTMMQMAEATGGKAYINTNSLADAVEKATEAGSNYYTLAYSPINREWKGEFRKIQVKLDQKDVKLAYRRGYYGDDPLKPARHGISDASISDQTHYNPMRAAMVWGAPGATEILFKVSVQPSSANPEDTLAPGNQSNGKVKGSYQRYTVSYTADTGDIRCDLTPDGVHHCALEFMTYVYDGNGNLITSQGTGAKANIPASAYASVQRDGIHLKQEISVPAKGEYFFRIGIHDLNSDHVGAVELPVSAVSKLPSFATEGAVATPESAPN
jgi:VWFA-related protein